VALDVSLTYNSEVWFPYLKEIVTIYICISLYLTGSREGMTSRESKGWLWEKHLLNSKYSVNVGWNTYMAYFLCGGSPRYSVLGRI
jgi:hypothetical protein